MWPTGSIYILTVHGQLVRATHEKGAEPLFDGWSVSSGVLDFAFRPTTIGDPFTFTMFGQDVKLLALTCHLASPSPGPPPLPPHSPFAVLRLRGGDASGLRKGGGGALTSNQPGAVGAENRIFSSPVAMAMLAIIGILGFWLCVKDTCITRLCCPCCSSKPHRPSDSDRRALRADGSFGGQRGQELNDAALEAGGMHDDDDDDEDEDEDGDGDGE